MGSPKSQWMGKPVRKVVAFVEVRSETSGRKYHVAVLECGHGGEVPKSLFDNRQRQGVTCDLCPTVANGVVPPIEMPLSLPTPAPTTGAATTTLAAITPAPTPPGSAAAAIGVLENAVAQLLREQAAQSERANRLEETVAQLEAHVERLLRDSPEEPQQPAARLVVQTETLAFNLNDEEEMP